MARLLLLAALLPAAAQALTLPMPPPGDDVVGQMSEATTRYEDTFADIARAHDVGFREITAANPQYDPWIPGAGVNVSVPNRFILPDAPRDGIVINLAELRLYYFPRGQNVVITHPIGIGREGWATPVADTHIAAKKPNPTWTPPDSIRAEHAARGDILPAVVPAGPNNPLGAYAMPLALQGYLIHGTNKPFGVGMRVSHGCIRLYPEDIESLFQQVPVGTPVHIINQPYKVGWHGGLLYVEAHPPLEEERQTEGLNFTPLVTAITKATGGDTHDVDWDQARAIGRLHTGVPTALIPLSEPRTQTVEAAPETPANTPAVLTTDTPAPVAEQAPAAAVPAEVAEAAPADEPGQEAPAASVQPAVPDTAAAAAVAAAPAASDAPLFDPASVYGEPDYGFMPDPAYRGSAVTPAAPAPEPTAAAEPVVAPPAEPAPAAAPVATLPVAPAADQSVPLADPDSLWHLQVGAFSDPNGVERISADIRSINLPLRVESVAGHTLQRVLVGPFRSAAEAMAARVRVREIIGIEPTLVPPRNGAGQS